jgi:hypothetical protein
VSVELTIDETADRLVIRWRTPRSSGEAMFDRLPGTVPEWLASADDLFAGAARREEGWIADAVAEWASAAGVLVGLWHDGGGVEILVPGSGQA